MNHSPSSRLASDICPLIRRLKLPTVFQELLAGRGGKPTTGLTSLPAWRCPVGEVASGLAKLRRRLSQTFARNRPPRCGCPMRASFGRRGPVSWGAYSWCGCGLLPVETLEPLACPDWRGAHPSGGGLPVGPLAIIPPGRCHLVHQLPWAGRGTVACIRGFLPCGRAVRGRSLQLYVLKYGSPLWIPHTARQGEGGHSPPAAA